MADEPKGVVIKVGQVWQRFAGELQICIISVNKKTEQVYVAGLHNSIGPVVSVKDLVSDFYLTDDWQV